MAKHKWSESDTCIKCGLKRRKRPLTKTLRSYGVGKYLYDYFINNEWIAECNECIGKL